MGSTVDNLLLRIECLLICVQRYAKSLSVKRKALSDIFRVGICRFRFAYSDMRIAIF